jgi:tetratricopeptide (TPR) repeat protein
MRPVLALLLAASVVLASPEDEAQIRKLFETLGAAAKNGGATAVARHFDSRGVKAALKREGVEGPLLEGTLSEMGSLVGPGMIELGLDRVYVTSVAVAARTATAVADHYDAEDESWTRVRWSLLRCGDEWAITDFEVFRDGVPFAAMTGARIAAMNGSARADYDRFEEAERQGYYSRDALRTYRALQAGRLPTALRAVCRFRIAYTLCFTSTNDEEREETFAACDEAARLRPMPALHYIRAMAHWYLGQPEQAIESAYRYMEVAGPDPAVYWVISRVYQGLGKRTESAAACRAGLKVRPDAELVGELAVSLPADGKAEAAAAFRALPDAAERIETVAVRCTEEEDWAALAALVPAFREIAPDSLDTIAYHATVLEEEGVYEDAARLVFDVLRRTEDPEDREGWLEWYARTMVRANKLVEAYKAVPEDDRGEFFWTLLGNCPRDPDELEALIRIHAPHEDPDLLLTWHVEVHWLRGNYAEVARLMAEKADVIRRADKEYRHFAEDSWVRSLHRLGRKEEALRAAVKSEDSVLLLLAYAAKGDVDAATVELDRSLERNWTPAELYDDEDIGPLLKTEKFAPLRAKYPRGE